MTIQTYRKDDENAVIMQITDTGSGIPKEEMNKIFEENNITIPFPQRDLHIKSTEENKYLDQKTKDKEKEEDE